MRYWKLIGVQPVRVIAVSAEVTMSYRWVEITKEEFDAIRGVVISETIK